MNRRTLLKSLALGALAAVLPIRPMRAKAVPIGTIKCMYAVSDDLFIELHDGRCFIVRGDDELEEIPQIPFRLLGFQPAGSVVRHGA